ASLQHLSDQLILRQSHGDRIEGRPSLAAKFPKRVTVAALLGLKHQCALSFERGGAVQKLVRYRVAAPRIHMWAPWRVPRKMRECSQHNGDQKNRQDGDRSTTPTFFPFSRKKWQQDEKSDG